MRAWQPQQASACARSGRQMREVHHERDPHEQEAFVVPGCGGRVNAPGAPLALSMLRQDVAAVQLLQQVV